MKIRILLLLTLALWAGCKSPIAPEFKSINNISVVLEGLSRARLTAEALLYNPNKNAITLKDVDLNVWLEGSKVAGIKREYNMEIPRESDFTVPLEVDVDLADLDLSLLDTALGLMGTQGKEVKYLGKIRLKAYGIVFSVPVDYTDRLRIRL
jgi:LEA14-like dessication related protein